jgi:putative endonuclease
MNEKSGYKKRLGEWGEELAAQFLLKNGYELVEKNFQTRRGEIDLVVTRGEEIIFVEVKTRSKESFGYGEDAVNWRKRHKIQLTIDRYLEENKITLVPRFDVIVIEIDKLTPKIIHFEAVEI